jgi:hypothetical protein
MISTLLVLLALVTPPTQASEFEWTAQYAASIGVQLPIADHIDIRASVHQFGVPKTKASMRFVYTGPVFNIAPWFWVSPQVGVMSGWMPDGSDAALGSVWFGATHGSFSLFGEGDVYVASDNPTDIYGYVAADWNHGVVNLGFQSENVNTAFVIGPHVGATKGAFHIQLEGYVDPNFSAGAVRFATAVNF